MPLCGKTVLEVMFARLKPFRDSLLVATSNRADDDAIEDVCRRNGVRCYRGELDDVLGRFAGALKTAGASGDDTVVRLTADCPLIDSGLVASCVALLKSGSYDYVSNCIKRTYPRGLDAEAMRAGALFDAHECSRDAFEREHVTPFIYRNPDRFSLGSLEESSDNSGYRLTLDESADYEMITTLYEKLGCKTDFDYRELLKTLKENPKIVAINSHVEQKK